MHGSSTLSAAQTLEALLVQRSRYALAYATAESTATRARHARTLDRLEHEIERCTEARDTEDPSKSLAARPMLELDFDEPAAAISGRFARLSARTWLWPALAAGVVCAALSAVTLVAASGVLHTPEIRAAATIQSPADQP